MIVPAQRWVKYWIPETVSILLLASARPHYVQGDVGCRSLLLAERAHRTHHIYRKAVLVQARSERPISPHRGGENERAWREHLTSASPPGLVASDRQVCGQAASWRGKGGWVKSYPSLQQVAYEKPSLQSLEKARRIIAEGDYPPSRMVKRVSLEGRKATV